jgi:predicted site-specific integrase-resolvase
MKVEVTPQTPFCDLPGYLTPSNIAAVLQKSPRTVTRWCVNGDIPEAINICGRWTVPKEALVEFLAKHSTSTQRAKLF